ncbi:DUF6655 family protein [Tundrisphaera sp. TA3]|uniref:DUF6655 family protein n=1 Tax=Tundrisphaera sp. TA3 TaxID=3435775 RepID=UPI003EBD1205
MSKRSRRSKAAWGGVAASFLLAASGCGTTKVTGTSRTGTEQLLLTSAWDKALHRVDFRPLTGVPVYLDTTHVTAVDQGWVVSSLRQAMLTQGVLIRPKPEQAQYILEAAVGAYGTNEDSFLLGMPQTTVPNVMPGIPSGTIPEVTLAKRSRQQAVAKLSLFAYDRASGQLVWSSGTLLDKADTKDVYIGGFGPIKSGTIQSGTEVAGIKIPLGDTSADAEEGSDRRRDRDPRRVADSLPNISAPSNLSDLDSFKP